MKVLYIGHYKEFGGWSQAATDYILALDKIGVDVVCRNVTLTQDRSDVEPRLLELELKDTSDCDVCIQHVLPHHLIGTTNFRKNIAFLASESTSIQHLTWLDHLKQMDEIWVPNSQSKEFLEKDGVGIPVSVVPHTTNINKYKKQFREINIEQARDKFKFYYIGDFNDRKNLESVITCFHSEFDKTDSAVLVLKLNKFGKSPQEITQTMDGLITEIKTKLRIHENPQSYLKDIIISEKISNDDILALHNYCDCFICPSHGEAWSIPSFDAMAFGNTPICSNFGGPKEFINKADWRTGHLINGVYSCCKCSDAAFPDLFTAKEYWFQPCEMQIKESMRKAYESWKKNPIMYTNRNRSAGLKQAEKFSYDTIGKLMKELISE